MRGREPGRTRSKGKWAVLATAGFLFACGASSYEASDPWASVTPKNVTGDPALFVPTACTPTGPELCFNAHDDNCNGVIDEGCGSGTGVLQFMIAWADSPADVDLQVTDPEGKRVSKKNRTIPSGLRLEKDCPDDGCHAQNVENVYFDGGEPRRGTYRVEVKLVDPRGAELPVKVHLSARVGRRTFAMDLALSPEQAQENRGWTFEL